MRTCNDVLETIGRNMQHLRNMGVRRLGLFGSCARDEHSQSSDLDFVVEFERKSFDAYMDLKFFLEDLFDCSVDLVTFDSIRPELRDSILQEVVYVPQL